VAQLTTGELELIHRARDAYQDLFAAPCTGCGYCMPCPNGVDIPRTFAALNNGVTYSNMEEARRRYQHRMSDQPETIYASSCIQCGICETKCPQGILVSEWMPYAHEILAEGREYKPEERPGS
jgi:hypothetical protein